jgi:hypothetical protein
LGGRRRAIDERAPSGDLMTLAAAAWEQQRWVTPLAPASLEKILR